MLKTDSKTNTTHKCVKPVAERGGALGRRTLFAGAAAVAATTDAVAARNPDAELIARANRFAEAEIGFWYQRAVTSADVLDEHWDAIEPEVQWIEAAPATTPAGWQAKALACSAWDMPSYDTPDAGNTLAASLMHAMAGPARAAIIARLTKRFGPWPERCVTADGRLLRNSAA